MKTALICTCEHAGNRVPAGYRILFAGKEPVLDTHRGFDIGAYDAARIIAHRLDAPLIAHHFSRLLVDVNRSARNPRAFSEMTRPLPLEERSILLARYHTPHRDTVQGMVDGCIEDDYRVLHLSIHSFTPVLHGKTRQAEVGLLYDPARERERTFARLVRAALCDLHGDWRVRMNYPYRGVSDGLTTYLRSLWPDRWYAGIEIEFNQACLATPAGIRKAANLFADAAASAGGQNGIPLL